MTIDSATDRNRWNAKFLAGEAQSVEPDPFLIEACADLTPARSLDLAGGAGRHALWLAQRGWSATLADISDEGLAIAARRATESGVPLNIRCEFAAETIAWASGTRQFETAPFDLITVFWCLLRDHFAALPQAVAPGGTLLYKTYTSDHKRFTEGHSLRFALDPGELKTAFPPLDTILYREADGVSELIARAR
jgi:2-polyprenyl-3-methyl-5-hydroxy-6-metoxy-1,4-benzoquinol methylase